MKKFFLCLLSISIVYSFGYDASAVVTENEQLSVVQIMIYDEAGDPYSWGSGVIIDGIGHVITNYHVIEPVLANASYDMSLCVTTDPYEPPVCAFKAAIADTNQVFDLALLTVTNVYMGGAWKTLNEFLTAAGLSELFHVNFDRRENSTEAVGLGDDLQILGYPGFGGSSITFTKGTISGFQRVEVDGEYLPYQIKTDAKVNPGNSGGGAFDAENNFIGIPTAVVGGYGNIGYVISLPIINYFLDKTLGEPQACLDMVNGFMAADGECYCNEGYAWSTEKNKCAVTGACSANSFEYDGACYCKDEFVRVDGECLAFTEYCQRGYGQNVYGVWDVQKEETMCYCESGYEWGEDGMSCVSTGGAVSGIDQTNDPWVTSQIDDLLPTDWTMVNRLLGRILLQVNDHGEAWYLDPVSKERFYMKDGSTAYQMLRSFGLGVTEVDYAKLETGNATLLSRLKGRIVLRVQAHGEAYYVHPKDLSVHYLKDGAAAYQIMRELSLGITNGDLSRIPIQRFVPLAK